MRLWSKNIWTQTVEPSQFQGMLRLMDHGSLTVDTRGLPWIDGVNGYIFSHVPYFCGFNTPVTWSHNLHCCFQAIAQSHINPYPRLLRYPNDYFDISNKKWQIQNYNYTNKYIPFSPIRSSSNGGFHKWGYLHIINVYGIFSLINHPFCVVSPWLGNPWAIINYILTMYWPWDLRSWQ